MFQHIDREDPIEIVIRILWQTRLPPLIGDAEDLVDFLEGFGLVDQLNTVGRLPQYVLRYVAGELVEDDRQRGLEAFPLPDVGRIEAM